MISCLWYSIGIWTAVVVFALPLESMTIPDMETQGETPRLVVPHLRILTTQDQEGIWEVLKYAAHETEDVRESTILQPYGKDFGTCPGDFGVGAFCDDENGGQQQLVGAAWIRSLYDKGGFCEISDKLPELAMAVFPSHQGQGIGTNLLERLLQLCRDQNGEATIRGVCLSCRSENEVALSLYQKLGFTKILGSEKDNRVGGTSINMVHYFRDTSS